MAKNVELKKKIGNSIECIYPKTLAANVYTESGKTVETRISELNTEITNLKAKLFLDSIYMTDSNDQIITDGDERFNDGSGLNLVAVY